MESHVFARLHPIAAVEGVPPAGCSNGRDLTGEFSISRTKQVVLVLVGNLYGLDHQFGVKSYKDKSLIFG